MHKNELLFPFSKEKLHLNELENFWVMSIDIVYIDWKWGFSQT